MHPTLGDQALLREGVAHVARSDPKIEALVKEQGMLSFKPRGRVFPSLVESIIAQQLNGTVADLITSRVNALFAPGRISPERLHRISGARLRKAGLSPQKLTYLKDLSSRVVKGQLDLERLRSMNDEEVVKVLDEVKGVGRWTAQMVLMFSLGRPDVLPTDDYGIRKAVERVYRLREVPDRITLERIGMPWHPFSSVACLYLWGSRGNDPR